MIHGVNLFVNWWFNNSNIIRNQSKLQIIRNLNVILKKYWYKDMHINWYYVVLNINITTLRLLDN